MQNMEKLKFLNRYLSLHLGFFSSPSLEVVRFLNPGSPLFPHCLVLPDLGCGPPSTIPHSTVPVPMMILYPRGSIFPSEQELNHSALRPRLHGCTWQLVAPLAHLALALASLPGPSAPCACFWSRFTYPYLDQFVPSYTHGYVWPCSEVCV